MKKLTRIFLLGLSISALDAQAEGWYMGASAGIMDNDVGGFDDAVNAGLLLGYDIYTLDIFTLSLEGEVTTTVSDGDVELNGVNGDWDIDTQAAYIAAALGDRAYIKVRYGAIRRDISVDVGNVSASDSETNFSWAAALGWMFNKNWGVQVDGTLVESDVNYWNAGVKYRFQ